MQERRNYYRILGVQPDAPKDVIRGVYRTLMQKLRMHPDLGGDVRTAAIVNEAWRVLRDPVSRRAYDEQLLSDFDIRLVAGAGNPDQSPKTGDGPNRRNHYRILGVQADAPQALIESAHRTKTGDPSADAELVAEAYRILGDAGRRRRYDAGLDPQPSEPPVQPAAEAAGAESTDYRPVIRTFCLFCKTPHSAYPGRSPTDHCSVCNSPLQRLVPSASRADRSFDRFGFTGPVKFYEYWPSEAIQGQLTDFTPDGLRLMARKKLDSGQVVRVSAAVFEAVARVVHSVPVDNSYSSGMALLTASFSTDGMFINLKG